MRKIKPYIFNGVECSDLNSLAEEYIKDFFNGMEDIYKNAKELLKFVKRTRNDKDFTNEIAEILVNTKYKNNALTFIIFAFTGYGRVVINGEELAFASFINAIKKNNEEGNALYSFIEDKGLTKTYVRLNKDDNLAKNSEAIEANFNEPFTKKYLESYYDFKSSLAIANRVNNCVLGNEECFKKGTELSKSEEFQLAIAHQVGFKEAVTLSKEKNPIFEAVKVIKATNEVEDEKLLLLIQDTFYWWLLDNVDKYTPKSKDSKLLFESIYALKRKYDKIIDMKKKKKIYDLSVERIADISKDLYIYYLDFVTLTRSDEIVIKKKFKNNYDYVFDKPYCDTFVCQSFMEGKVLKLTAKEEEPEKVNILTGEKLESEVKEDNENMKEENAKPKKEKKAKKPKKEKRELESLKTKPVNLDSEILLPEDLKLKKLNRKVSKNMRFKGFVIFELVLIILLVAVALGIEQLVTNNIIQLEALNGLSFDGIYKSQTIIFAAGGCLALLLIFLPILGHKNKVSERAIRNLQFVETNAKSDNLSPQAINEINKIMAKSEKEIKQAKASSRVVTALNLAFIATLFSMLLFFVLVVLNQFGVIEELANLEAIKSLPFYSSMSMDLVNNLTKPLAEASFLNMMDVCLIVSALITLIFGFIKKYKGVLSVLLVNLLVIIAVIAVLVFLTPLVA